MKVGGVNIDAAFAELAPLDLNDEEIPADPLKASFAQLSEYRDGGVFASSFTGHSPWEHHPEDELLIIVDGATELILWCDGEEERATLSTGELLVVPARTWHRFETAGVRTIGVTPQPTATCSGIYPDD